MRTPEEIKKGLQCIANVRKNGCSESPCGLCKLYVTNYYSGEVCADALAYIEQLEAGNADLAAIVEHAYRQRDAAMEELRGRCNVCVHAEPRKKASTMIKCRRRTEMLGVEVMTIGYSKGNCDLWEWRGYKDE